MIAHVDVHALFDGMPQSRGCRVQGVVQVEEDGSEFHGGDYTCMRFILAYIIGKPSCMLHGL